MNYTYSGPLFYQESREYLLKRFSYSGPIGYIHGVVLGPAEHVSLSGPLDVDLSSSGDNSFISNLSGRIRKWDAIAPVDLLSTIRVQATLYSVLGGTIHVTPVFYSDLTCEIEVLPGVQTPITYEIPAVLTLKKRPVIADLTSRLKKQTRINSSLGSVLHMDAMLLPSTIRVQVRLTSNLNGKIKVLVDAPEPPGSLRANVPFGQWQANPNVTYEWDAAVANITPVDHYRYFLDNNSESTLGDHWETTESLSATYNLNDSQYGPGKWWFHVVAVSEAGYASNPTSAVVWYNHLPSNPGSTYMTVNGNDTLLSTPIVSSSAAATFEWSGSTDDDGGSLSYQIQFAYQSNFDFDYQYSQSSIVKTIENGNSTSLNMVEILKPGIWFWRIRAWDGRQYSEWSPVGSFRFNKPPGPPTELIVLQV